MFVQYNVRCVLDPCGIVRLVGGRWCGPVALDCCSFSIAIVPGGSIFSYKLNRQHCILRAIIVLMSVFASYESI